jgi:hypothetical protein
MIHGYNAEPTGGWVIQGVVKNPIGVELEVDYQGYEPTNQHYCCIDCHGPRSIWEGQRLESIQTKIDEKLAEVKWLFLKRDSSLKNGVEVVSHPMGLGSHKRKWPEVLEFLGGVGKLRPHDEQGLHFHFKVQEYQIVRDFVLDYPKELQEIAGRGENEFCVFNKGNHHHSVINRRDDNRCEFRLCRSTVKIDEFFARLELAHALASIASVEEMEWGEFWERCQERPVMYKELLLIGGKS